MQTPDQSCAKPRGKPFSRGADPRRNPGGRPRTEVAHRQEVAHSTKPAVPPVNAAPGTGLAELVGKVRSDPDRGKRAVQPPDLPLEPPYLRAMVPEGVKLAPEADGIRLFIQPPPRRESVFGFSRAQIEEMRLYLIGELATGEN